MRTVNWFLPDLDSPFYGGVNTAFRIADQLAADHGVVNRFVLMAAANERFFRSALAAAFPRLADVAARLLRRVARVDGGLRARPPTSRSRPCG